MSNNSPALAPANPDGSSKKRVVGDYVVTKKIGEGSFANVWRGQHSVTGQEVAIKSISREKINLNKKHQENVESEIAIMKRLHHENIVSLYDIQTTERHIYLILELCTGGDLSKYIRKHGRMSIETARHFLRQLAAGLRFMREHNLVHRDLKPQNLLLDHEAADATLKIADFGFARVIQPQSLAATLCGSPLYMAPEILRSQKYDAMADLWSVGTILYEMLVGRPPFNAANHVELLNRIQTTEVQFPSDLVLPEDCLHLLRGLLKRNPQDRMSFQEFFSHPFLQLPPLPDKALSESKASHHSRHSSGSQQQQNQQQQQQQQQPQQQAPQSSPHPQASPHPSASHHSQSSKESTPVPSPHPAQQAQSSHLGHNSPNQPGSRPTSQHGNRPPEPAAALQSESVRYHPGGQPAAGYDPPSLAGAAAHSVANAKIASRPQSRSGSPSQNPLAAQNTESPRRDSPNAGGQSHYYTPTSSQHFAADGSGHTEHRSQTRHSGLRADSPPHDWVERTYPPTDAEEYHDDHRGRYEAQQQQQQQQQQYQQHRHAYPEPLSNTTRFQGAVDAYGQYGHRQGQSNLPPLSQPSAAMYASDVAASPLKSPGDAASGDASTGSMRQGQASVDMKDYVFVSDGERDTFSPVHGNTTTISLLQTLNNANPNTTAGGANRYSNNPQLTAANSNNGYAYFNQEQQQPQQQQFADPAYQDMPAMSPQFQHTDSLDYGDAYPVADNLNAQQISAAEEAMLQPAAHMELDFASSTEAYEFFSSMSKRALLVARLADLKSNTEAPSAMVLFVKALDLCHLCISAIANYHARRNASLQNTLQRMQLEQQQQQMFPPEDEDPRIAKLQQFMWRTFQSYFRKLNRLQEAIDLRSLASHPFKSSPSLTAQSSSASTLSVSTVFMSAPPPCAEKLLYDWGRQLAKEAAVDELMGATSNALKKYKRAYRVFEQLAAEKDVTEGDLNIIHSYMTSFYARIDTLQKQGVTYKEDKGL